jgi:hypothetical protein
MLETARQQWDEGLRRLDTVGAETARGRHLWLPHYARGASDYRP